MLSMFVVGFPCLLVVRRLLFVVCSLLIADGCALLFAVVCCCSLLFVVVCC